MGAITATLKDATPSTANATSYASGSYTPAANRLLIAGVQASRGSSTDPPTPTLAGNGLTWALAQDPVTLALADNLFQASGTLRDRLCVFRALTGATPSAGAVTATYGATCTGCTIIVAEVDLADLTAPFVQMRMVAVGAASATVSMDAFEDADNAVISFFAVDAAATIVGEHSELADITYATPAREHMAQFLNVADTSPSATWTGANTAGGIALELRQAAGGGTEHFGAASLEITDSIVAAGKKDAKGAASAPSTLTAAVAAKKTAHAASALPITVAVAAAAKRVAHGATDLGLSASVATASKKNANATTVLPLTLGIAVSGETGGAVSGAVSLEATFGATTTGKRTAHAAAALALSVSVATQGTLTRKGAAALDLILGTETSGQRGAFGSATLPLAFTFATAGLIGALPIVTAHFDQPNPAGGFDPGTANLAGGSDPGSPGGAHFDQPTPGQVLA